MTVIDEIVVTRKIFDRFSREFLDHLDVDVALVGGGPANMVAAHYLAKAGKKVVLFERKLAPGGGMWGGGMNFPVIVIQEAALPIMNEFGIKVEGSNDGYYTADSVECVAKLLAKSIDSGARVFNSMTVQDVMIRDDDNKVSGVVINWTGVDITKMHVDPLTIRAKFVVDGTGHPCEVCNVVAKKAGRLRTPSGKVEGERSMWAEVGEETTVNNTVEIYPGLYVAGMAANGVMGAPRMGPIFGGMLLSGKKVAEMILQKLGA
ncbi:MAG: ribose 1,5-bisphosphate isomerase [Thermoplasmata archaeon HGW-Thermoplasmata-1]|nr:MAG: ribose 1,5-bisphosphate isomerase [Thermoplasmata archaeon HGW-Thermoplasmata-1]